MKRLAFLGEAAFVAVLVAGINVLIPADPYFASLAVLPYFLLPAFFASVYGPRGAAAGSLAAVVGLVLEGAVSGAEFPWFHSLAGVLFGGVGAGIVLYVRDLFRRQRRDFLDRLRKTLARTRRLERENTVLGAVTRDLELRMTREKRSLSFLLARLKSLEKGGLDTALQEILDAVRVFTRAESLSIWRFDEESRLLKLVSSLGRLKTDGNYAPQPVDSSLIGWVFRNGQPFSLRMLAQPELRNHIPKGDSLIAYPLRAGETLWGVLSIEAMPFVAYSKYAETALELILTVSERVLRPLVERQRLFDTNEVHELTRVPRTSLLVAHLSEEMQRARRHRLSLSAVVLQVANFQDLKDRYGRVPFLELMGQVARFVKVKVEGVVGVFHYREENQLSFVLPGRDNDGTALVCLSLLGDLQSNPWEVGGECPVLEIYLGFSTLRAGETEPDQVLDSAQRLLEMQRL